LLEGGGHGKLFELRLGDVAILPAGTVHQGVRGSRDLLAVGALFARLQI
jgi:uncharacterized protein YjlB